MLERELGIVVGEHGEIRRGGRHVLRRLIRRLRLLRDLIEALRVALRLVEAAVGAVALAVAEVDVVRYDLGRAALVAFLVLPVADLQPAGDDRKPRSCCPW